MAKEKPTVSDAELDAAVVDDPSAEPVVEPDTEGEKTDEEKQAELEAAEAEEAKLKEEEHKERSALGRKVKGIEERFDSLDGKIDELMAGMKPSEPDDDEDFVPSTKKELDDYLTKWKAGETQKDRKYQDDYMLGIGKYREEEDFKEIKEELNKNFNFRNSDNGVLDAEVNYLKASRAYLKKKLSGVKPESPLKGDPPKGPLGVGSDGEPIEEGEPSVPKLDEHAQAFVDKVGMSKESVKDALTGETPSYLKGGV